MKKKIKKTRPPSKIVLALNEIEKLKILIEELQQTVSYQKAEINNLTKTSEHNKLAERVGNCSNRLERIENRFDCHTNGNGGYKSGGSYGVGPGYTTNPFSGGGWR